MSCVEQVLYLLASVLWSKECTLAQGVCHTERGAVPGIELLDEIPWSHRFSNHDALFEIWNLAPVGDLIDDAVNTLLKQFIAFATNGRISCDWNKYE